MDNTIALEEIPSDKAGNYVFYADHVFRQPELLHIQPMTGQDRTGQSSVNVNILYPVSIMASHIDVDHLS